MKNKRNKAFYIIRDKNTHTITIKITITITITIFISCVSLKDYPSLLSFLPSLKLI